MMQQWMTLLLVASGALSCIRNSEQAGDDYGGGSSLSSLEIRLPDRSRFGAKQNLLSGYRLIIEPTSNGCPNPTQANDVRSWAQSILETKVAQGCDYSIGLELGELASGALSAVYFTNYRGAGQGQRLLASEIAGRDRVQLTLRLEPTDAARKAGLAGGSASDGDLILDIGLGSSTTLPPRPNTTLDGNLPPRTTLPPPTTPPTTPQPNGSDFSAVQSILARHCTECHSQGGVDPQLGRFPFVTQKFSSSAQVARRIIETIEGGRMPPQPRSAPSADELNKLKTWAAGVR
jgi:hypothetical protein